MGRKPKRTAIREKGNDRAEPSKATGPAASYGGGEAALFALTLFVSAALLFTVEPMFAKMVLPRMGGAPGVWNACLVFYQAALLAGYLYAHLSLKWLGARRQAVLHLALLAVACFMLPIHLAKGWLPSAATFAVPRLWLLLAVSLGLPFLAVSASAPMLQAWFARTRRPAARDPYFLYAASNLGSLLALPAYPLLIEAKAGLARQSLGWAIGYGLLIVLVAACAVKLWRTPVEPGPRSKGDGDFPTRPASPISTTRRLRWLALSLVPSSLLLGVTTYITADVAPMPFLWVAPLALYLLTFVLVFAPRTIVPLRWMVRGQPLLIVATAATLLCSGGGAGMKEFLLFGSLHLATFFVTAMVCHGQLAADRPAPSQLTEFYLWMSLGGVAGGLLTALVAPLVFKSVLEYPLMMAAACLLRPRPVFSGGVGRKDTLPIAALLFCLVAAWGLRTGSFLSGLRYTDSPGVRVALVALAAFATFLLRRRPVVFGTAVALLAATSLWSVETGYRLLDAQRGFLGILRVEYDPLWNMNQLLNGTTSHGQQSRFESQRREPQGYFHRRGPLGAIFNRLKPRRPLAEVGVLGLGVGTIAAYAEPGERFTFYEINPAVEQIARNTDYFTYLADCRGEVEVIPGDARLSLESEQERQFDLLIVDVYSSDSVPIHLTTHEAMQIYFKHLKPGGLLAIHISSRYFDLAPFLGNLAAEDGRTARIWRDLGLMEVVGKFPSVWVVMARSADDLGPLADAPWTPLKRDAGPLWTDDFSNVAAALRQEPWNSTGLRLKPMKWANQADGHAVLAGYLRTEGRTDEAIEHLRRALEIEPDNAENHLTLGTILVSLGRSDEALGHLQQAVNSNPDDKGAHSELGIALYRTGKTDEALAHFRQALAIDPGYVEGLRNLAKALVDGRQFDEAVECFRKAITIQPGNAEIRFDLGLALIRQGNISAAKEELRQALSLTDGKDAALVEKIKAEIRRCDAWPWEEETK